MEINFEKKKLLKSRIKELESQLEEKSFILTAINHQDDQTKQKTSSPFRKQNNSLLIIKTYLKNPNFPNIINETPKKPALINNKNRSKTPILKRILQRANSFGKSPDNEKSCCESDLNENHDKSMILLKEYKSKNEQLKLRIKKISERFLSELSNKEKEIFDLKKFKNSYIVLTEKMKVFKINDKGDSNNKEKSINNEKSVNSLTIENENLKEEIKFMQRTLEEKDSKIKVLTVEDEKNDKKIEKMENKLKYVMLKKQALEKQMLIFKEKSFQMNLLIKKLENDVNDKKTMISNFKNQLREVGSNPEFENKRPGSSKNVYFFLFLVNIFMLNCLKNLRYENKMDLNDFENELKYSLEEKQKKANFFKKSMK